jgi:hypothetical protein
MAPKNEEQQTMISKVSMSQGIRFLTGLLAAGMVCVAASAAAPEATAFKPGKVPPTNQPDISGVWLVTNFSPFGKTIDGKDPPLQKWARDIAVQRQALAAQGHPFPDSETYCFTPGMPRMMFGPGYPIQILQTAGQVTMLFEILHNVRFIYLTDKHSSLNDIDPSYHGESIGHWEQDTLVIDTIDMTDKSTMDKAGTPHSDALHVVERIRLTGKNTMEDLVTMEDPKAFTAPWIFRATFEREPAGTRLQEYFCENNRNPVNQEGNVTFQGNK